MCEYSQREMELDRALSVSKRIYRCCGYAQRAYTDHNSSVDEQWHLLSWLQRGRARVLGNQASAAATRYRRRVCCDDVDGGGRLRLPSHTIAAATAGSGGGAGRVCLRLDVVPPASRQVQGIARVERHSERGGALRTRVVSVRQATGVDLRHRCLHRLAAAAATTTA